MLYRLYKYAVPTVSKIVYKIFDFKYFLIIFLKIRYKLDMLIATIKLLKLQLGPNVMIQTYLMSHIDSHLKIFVSRILYTLFLLLAKA